ncbi:MAG: N-acetylmuramoyl-L-alanine amidase [Candidatus Omnitrophica bacterium]|nr:N-acetylmuramoyl-L-alanine amidase [Candidatus Omnitrophota bacterium]
MVGGNCFNVKMQKSKVKSQKSKSKSKSFSIWILLLPFTFLLSTFYGCATIPQTTAIHSYNINGTNYFSLVSLCDANNMDLEYDTFSHRAVLTKGVHKINLMVGDTLVLVDGLAQQLKHPVDIYEGVVMVPCRFKEQVLDSLFKESPAYAKTKSVYPPCRIKKVVIDPGHGGNDPGAIGRTGLREKDVNLDIAKRLSSLLRAEGIEVVMTRNSDSFIPLSRRVEIANNSAADLFISVHANSNRVKSLNGFEVYYVSLSVNDSERALSSAKNAALALDGACLFRPSTDLKAILWDMIYTYDRAESIELAQNICRTMEGNLNTKILGIKDAKFFVLKGVNMPAILIEIGFVSNYEEERMLKNGYFRQQIADTIALGINNYSRDYTLTEVR